MFALLALLQDGTLTDLQEIREILAQPVEIVVCSDGDAEMHEVCEADKAAPDALRGFLKDGDREVRRNAACALALQGIADGLDLLAVEPNEPWTRRIRIGLARAKIDPEGGRGALRGLLDDPCLRARRSAAKVLGEKAREPEFTEAHRDAVAALASDSVELRDEATRALTDAPEAALVDERRRANDWEVLARLDDIIASIRARERPPVTLEDAGILPSEVKNCTRKLTLTNHTDEPLRYQGYDADTPTHGFERFDEASGSWKYECSMWCGRGAEDQTLAAGASITILASDTLAESFDARRFRIYDEYRGKARVIRVYSPPLTADR